MKKYDYAVVIGRFQIPHHGHQTLLESAFNNANKVIILCGSDKRARSIKNPFTVEERAEMLHMILTTNLQKYEKEFIIRGIRDYPYNDQKWATEVQNKVNNIVHNDIFGFHSSVCLVGFTKDVETTEYLSMFPQWDFINIEQQGPLSATEIRELYFDTDDATFTNIAQSIISKNTLSYLLCWKNTQHYKILKEDYDSINKIKSMWKFSPYTPTFNATDAVVIESGHVLLIKRGQAPGKGLWALPGGHVNDGEKLIDTMIRELREETKIDCPVKILKGSIKILNKVFDHPDRDPRGRYFSHASLIVLPAQAGKLSKIKAADDACDVKWIPLSHLDNMREEIFSDHYDIIETLIGANLS